MQEFLVDKFNENVRLDKFIINKLGDIPYSLIAKFVRKGLIKINNKKLNCSSYRVKLNDIISIRVKIDNSLNNNNINKKNHDDNFLNNVSKIIESIIYRDSSIIVINKPSGIASQGGTGVDFAVTDAFEYLKFNYPIAPKNCT